MPRGKLVFKDIIVRVNGETVFDVNEERPTCAFDSVIDRMRSTGPGESLVLDLMRLSSEPIPRRVRVTKVLPRYCGLSSNIIFTPELLQSIRDKVLGDAYGPNEAAAAVAASSASRYALSVDAEDTPSDQFSTTLIVAGWSDLVQSTKTIITDVLHSHVICQKQNTMLRSNDNIELDLRLDPGRKMGLYLDDFGHTYLPQMRRSTCGVWFNIQPGEQMSSILGQSTELGGVLLKIGDRAVDSIDDASNAWTLLRDGSKGIVTICMHKNADTSSISQSHLVREPRRRGGGAYRGPLHVPATSASNLNTEQPSGAASSKRKRKLSDGDDSDQKRKREVAPYANGNNNGRETTVSNISLNVNEYQRFRAKMSRIFDVEFKAHGFQKSAVIKSAWSLHKSLIGNTCDDSCSCPSRLRDICANVVKEHLEKMQQEEGHDWTNPLKLRPDEFPIGFISRFVPKFISRVEKEMPGSNTTEVLDMLIQMWGKHKKASCSSSCTCQDDWDRMFKSKVVLAAMEAPSNAPRVSSGISSSRSHPPMAGQSSSEGSSMAVVRSAQKVFGRSRSPSPSIETNLIPKKATSSTIGEDAGTSSSISRTSRGTAKSATEVQSAAILNSLLPESVEKPFIVTFDTSNGSTKPLGLFFTTDRKKRNGSDDTVCRVASLCPYYTGKRPNAKIKVGSFVVGTAPNSTSSKKIPAMERLNSHQSLKERYEAACGDESIASFNVWFVNSDVLPSAATNTVAAGKRDWSPSGEWLGRSKVAGWAGGAPTRASAAPPKERSNNAASKTAAEQNKGDAAKKCAGDTNTTIGHASSSDTQNSSIDPDTCTTSPTARFVNPMTKKKLHGRTSSLLLCPDRERKVGRRVSFCKNGHQTREYVIGSSVTGRIVEDSEVPMMKSARSSTQDNSTSIDADDEGGDATPGSPTKGAALDMDVPINVRRSKKLFEAILDGDYRDVLRLLKDGAPVSIRDKNNLAPYDHVKKKIVALESQLREAGPADKPMLQDSLADFKRKSILLKIYIHVEHNISLLWGIDDWQNVQIAVDSMNSLSLSPEGREHPSSDFVFCVMVLENR